MAIGTGWADGAWIDAGWVTGAWESTNNTTINVGLDTLTLTDNNVTVNAETSFTVNLDSVTLTDNNVTLNAETSITANLDTLTLSEFAATITTTGDTSITAGLDTLTLTEYAASITAGDTAVSYGGFLPELVERKLRKKDQDVLNDVIELVNKAEEIPLPQNIVKQVKQVEKKAEKTFKIQPIRIRNRELIETKERLIKVEGLVNRYVKELQDDEEEAIKALLEVI